MFMTPWFNTIAQVVNPGALEIPLKHLCDNLNYWKKKLEEVEAKEKEVCPDSSGKPSKKDIPDNDESKNSRASLV